MGLIIYYVFFSDCHAQFHLVETKEENGTIESVQIYGCLSHNGHEREERFLRVSAKDKEKIADLKKIGVPPNTIKTDHFALQDSNNNANEQPNEQKVGGKPPLLKDIKRIARLACPDHDFQNWPKAEAMMMLVEKPDVYLFNFGSVLENQEALLNDATRKKFCPTENDRFIFFRMSEFGRRMFRENPGQLFVDGTHKTCNEEAIRVTWLVLDRRGEGVIIASAVVKTEKEDLITLCTQKLFELEPDVSSFTIYFLMCYVISSSYHKYFCNS